MRLVSLVCPVAQKFAAHPLDELIEEDLRTLLERATQKSAKTTCCRIFASNLPKRRSALRTSTTVPDVEPTNHVERGLRGAVIYRKLSLGNRSAQGERTMEHLLSASVTRRLQKRSLHHHLTYVVNAKVRCDPTPSRCPAEFRRG